MDRSGNPETFLMEHRWGQRLPCRVNVKIIAGPGVAGAGRVRDVSSSGAFIETALGLTVCTPVALVVVVEDESATHEVEINACVVRVNNEGVGVEWCDTPAGSICGVLGCTRRCVKGEMK